ncbi:hypothetical protein MMON44395_02105 [Mycolicibacterium monacense DSM 44395]|nr:hypothetical protein [Mycolicibacterium monacense DSM 44395]
MQPGVFEQATGRQVVDERAEWDADEHHDGSLQPTRQAKA